MASQGGGSGSGGPSSYAERRFHAFHRAPILEAVSSHRRTRLFRVATTGVICFCAGLVAGCDGGSAPATTASAQTTTSAPAATSAPTPRATATSTTPTPPAASSGSAQPAPSTAAGPKANPLFPLTPGFQSVRQGFVNKGSRRLSHRLVFTVTDVTKDVDGMRSVVTVDQDFDGGELAEQSLDFFAVKEDSTVLYVGSYTETYEGGQFVNSTDAWLSGANGAQAGTFMPANPKAGTPSFKQAVVPGEGAVTVEVTQTSARRCVPFRCFSDVVVLQEDGSEDKYFAPGVGGILTVPLSGDPQETEELVNVVELSSSGLAELSAEALRLDAHARTQSPDVFGSSPRARRAS